MSTQSQAKFFLRYCPSIEKVKRFGVRCKQCKRTMNSSLSCSSSGDASKKTRTNWNDENIFAEQIWGLVQWCAIITTTTTARIKGNKKRVIKQSFQSTKNTNYIRSFVRSLIGLLVVAVVVIVFQIENIEWDMLIVIFPMPTLWAIIIWFDAL